MRRLVAILGLVLGVYLIGRAAAEPFLVDIGDPATYRDDWGGPSLVGVLTVHCGPGLLAAAAILAFAYRTRRARAGNPVRATSAPGPRRDPRG